MLQVLLVILIFIQLAMIYRSARESNVRRIELRYKLRRREKLEEGLRKDTEQAADSIEKISMQLAEVEAKVKETAVELERVEAKRDAIKAKPPIRIYVFDRSTLTSENLWEVMIANPDFMELASAKRATPELLDEWRNGRIFLVASSTGEDAAGRCGARFPSSLGYRVQNIAPFRGLNRRS